MYASAFKSITLASIKHIIIGSQVFNMPQNQLPVYIPLILQRKYALCFLQENDRDNFRSPTITAKYEFSRTNIVIKKLIIINKKIRIAVIYSIIKEIVLDG